MEKGKKQNEKEKMECPYLNVDDGTSEDWKLEAPKREGGQWDWELGVVDGEKRVGEWCCVEVENGWWVAGNSGV